MAVGDASVPRGVRASRPEFLPCGSSVRRILGRDHPVRPDRVVTVARPGGIKPRVPLLLTGEQVQRVDAAVSLEVVSGAPTITYWKPSP